MEFVLSNCKNEKIRTSYRVSVLSDIFLDYKEILSEREIYKYTSFKTESGKSDFLLGRYSAKTAYMELKVSKKLCDIEIQNGIFGQPFFTNDSEFELSIAHSERIGGALVFDRSYPMGIDIETRSRSKNKTDVFQYITKPDEVESTKRIPACSSDDDQTLELIVAWCVKEALTKAIKTGLTIPTDLLRIEKFTKCDMLNDEDLFQCEYKNFPQYKGIAKISNNYVIAIAYPQQLTVNKFE